MRIDSENYMYDWRSISELRQIEEDISSFGYSKEFIAANTWLEKKKARSSSAITGRTAFRELLEVKEEDGSVFYREMENPVRLIKEEAPETFETQYGIFNNHNNGEFSSWLDRGDEDDFFIEGNYCDMFDCGEYSYAVSNLLHFGLGWIKIVKIDKDLQTTVLYDKDSENEWSCLSYVGRLKNEHGYLIAVSGFIVLDDEKTEKREFRGKTLLFQVFRDGNFSILKKWQAMVPSANSIAACGEYIYFGQNKMVTRLSLNSDEVVYLTNKSDAELAALGKVW